MSFSLTAGDTLEAIAETAATVTVNVYGNERDTTTGADDPKLLYQGQLGATSSVLYTVPAGFATSVTAIQVVNCHASAVKTFALFVNGDDDAHRIIPDINLLSKGFALYGSVGWQIYDSNGKLRTTAA